MDKRSFLQRTIILVLRHSKVKKVQERARKKARSNFGETKLWYEDILLEFLGKQRGTSSINL